MPLDGESYLLRYAMKIFSDFVEKAIDERLEEPLKNLYGGAILGGDIFLKEALNSLYTQQANRGAVWRFELFCCGQGTTEILNEGQMVE